MSRTASLASVCGALAIAPQAAAIELGGGGEQGVVGGVGYGVSLDEATGAIEVCLGASGGSSSDGDLGGIGGSGSGSVCVILTPPSMPESGISDPLSAVVQVGIPTPEGLTIVDVGAYANLDEPSICVALSVGGPGIEPESIEICLPPSGGELPEVPGLPEIPGLPDVPGLPGLPDVGGLPVPTDLLGDLPILGGGSGSPLDPVLSLLDGLDLPLPGDDGLPGGLPLDSILGPVFSLLGGLGLPAPPSL